MRAIEHFNHCPKCGKQLDAKAASNHIQCSACGFLLYFNPTVSVSAFIVNADGKALFIKRAKDPGKGKLAPPGGFVDFGETAETALRREIAEEVGLELGAVRYLCSSVNEYVFREVTYPVLDLFFTADASVGQTARALDDVESCLWLAPAEVQADDLAFESMKVAFREYIGISLCTIAASATQRPTSS